MIHSVGNRIKELRRKSKISQNQLCNEILSRTVLSKIENNKMLPSLPQLIHISNILNVDVSYFLRENVDSTNRLESELDSMQLNILESLYEKKKYLDIIEINESKKSKMFNHINFNYFVGMSYFRVDLKDLSIKHLKKYLSEFSTFNDQIQIKYIDNYATAINILSSIMISKSLYNKAINYLKQAKLVLNDYKKEDKKIYAVIINNLGSIYCLCHEYEKCIILLEEYLANNISPTYITILPSIHLSLNIAYFKTDQYDKALYHIENSIFLFKYINNSFDAGECYLNYINCLRYKKMFPECLALISKLETEYSLDSRLRNLFRIQKMIIYFNMQLYKEVILTSKDVNLLQLRRQSKVEYYYMLGHIAFIENKYTTAYNYLSKCERFMIAKKFFKDLSIIYNDLYCITNIEEYKINSKKYVDLKSEYIIAL